MSTRPRVPGGVVFLLAVVCVYGIAFALAPGAARAALTMAAGLLGQLVPVLALVFAVMFLVNLLVRPDWVRAHMGRDSGSRGWVIAVAGGILSPGPVYAWYALLRDLRTRGMRTALASVFLYNRGIKLPLLPLMIQYFGPGYTLILAACMTLFSLVGGLLLEWIVDGRRAGRGE